MFEFIVVMVFFFVILLAIYFPALHYNMVARKSKKRFIAELALLDNLFASCLFVRTERLGEGESQNSDVSFERAQENQSIAINSILGLIR